MNATVVDAGAANRPASRALAVSAVRCILTYLVLPVLVPVVGVVATLAVPLTVGLHLLAAGVAGRAFWRFSRDGRPAMACFMSLLVSINLIGLTGVG